MRHIIMIETDDTNAPYFVSLAQEDKFVTFQDEEGDDRNMNVTSISIENVE